MSIACRRLVSGVSIAALGLALASCDTPLPPTQPSPPAAPPTPLPAPAPPSGPCGPVAFVSNRDGRNAIYTATADCVITKIAEGEAPAWSPVSRQLAFEVRPAGGGAPDLHVINLDGSGRRRLTTGGSPTWSPDGRQIAFEVQPYGGIHVIDADGSDQRQLYAHDSGAFGPSWSPDGTLMAFWVGDIGDPPVSLFRMNADGSGATSLVSEGYSPAWSPDGMHVAFTGGGGVSVVQRDGVGRRLLIVGAHDPDWTTTDGRLVVTRGGGPSRLWVNEPGGLRQLVPDTVVLNYSDGQAAWLR